MQRVSLNGQYSSREPIQPGVPQGSVLVPLPLLIYINDLFENIMPTCKIFADDTSLFPPVFDKNFSQNELNNVLQIISD